MVHNWQDFEAAWDDYLLATQLIEKLTTADGAPNNAGMAQIAATLCAVMGAACKKVLSNLTAAQRRDPAAIIIEAMRQHFIPQRNVVFEHFIFLSASQNDGENADEYILRLRKLADFCEFENQKDLLK